MKHNIRQAFTLSVSQEVVEGAQKDLAQDLDKKLQTKRTESSVMAQNRTKLLQC